jgi:FKBP-type peptidyl-prolyl cis-trans isomerase FklB
MKKTIIVALALVASASFNTAVAGGKKDKKNKETATVNNVSLTNAEDSLSFAAGMTMTQGLMPYLEQQYGIKANQLPDVIRGFEDAARLRNDSVFTAYSAGQQIMSMVKGRMIPQITEDLGQINEDALYSGFAASLKKDNSLFTDSAAQKLFNDRRTAISNKRKEATRTAGEMFLAENAKKDGVKVTASGLQYKVLKEGNGPVPKATDKVKVIYEGRTLDGKVFDATSKHRGVEYDSFGVNGLIKGWTEALQLMPVGSKWELYIPQELAYGERGAGANIPPYSALIFTLELVGIE